MVSASPQKVDTNFSKLQIFVVWAKVVRVFWYLINVRAQIDMNKIEEAVQKYTNVSFKNLLATALGNCQEWFKLVIIGSDLSKFD